MRRESLPLGSPLAPNHASTSRYTAPSACDLALRSSLAHYGPHGIQKVFRDGVLQEDAERFKVRGFYKTCFFNQQVVVPIVQQLPA